MPAALAVAVADFVGVAFDVAVVVAEGADVFTGVGLRLGVGALEAATFVGAGVGLAVVESKARARLDLAASEDVLVDSLLTGTASWVRIS